MASLDRDDVRMALAGMAGAAAWAAVEPLAARAFGSPFTDVRLLGGLLTHGPRWRAAGVASHLVDGVIFGVVAGRLGIRGVRASIIAAQVENTALWWTMAVADRYHPDHRPGGPWPRLLTSRRVAAQEVAMHVLFGAVLGLACGRRS